MGTRGLDTQNEEFFAKMNSRVSENRFLPSILCDSLVRLPTRRFLETAEHAR
jgi:hypothetical protein